MLASKSFTRHGTERGGGGSCYFWVPLSPSGKGKGNRAPGCKISKLTSVKEQRI